MKSVVPKYPVSLNNRPFIVLLRISSNPVVRVHSRVSTCGKSCGSPLRPCSSVRHL